VPAAGDRSVSRVAAVIPAAGRGARIGFRTPKTFVALDGTTMIARTIGVFARSSRITYVQPVLPRSRVAAFRASARSRRGWTNCLPAVAGGRERQDSVAAGLRALPAGVEFVIVHDGARPLVPLALVHRVLDAARRHGAALAAVPVQDTVKRGTLEGFLQGTVERRNLWLAQTPQAFHLPLLLEAHAHARETGSWGTDDAGLVEALGHPVRIVPGSPLNLKITTREDLVIARALLREASRGGSRA